MKQVDAVCSLVTEERIRTFKYTWMLVLLFLSILLLQYYFLVPTGDKLVYATCPASSVQYPPYIAHYKTLVEGFDAAEPYSIVVIPRDCSTCGLSVPNTIRVQAFIHWYWLTTNMVDAILTDMWMFPTIIFIFWYRLRSASFNIHLSINKDTSIDNAADPVASVDTINQS